jgi:hypothetical protein
MRIVELLCQDAAFFSACLPALDAQIGRSRAIESEPRGQAGGDLSERAIKGGDFLQTTALVIVAGLVSAPFKISGGGGEARISSEGAHRYL